MLVSHSHKFIFIKTRKTAGTSVECFLERFCRPPNYTVTEKTDMAETEYGIVGARLFNETEFPPPKWFNHMNASGIKHRLSEDIWNSYYKITTIRNTFDRVVSFWWNYSMNDKYWISTISDKPFSYIKDQFKKVILSNTDLGYLCCKELVFINNENVIDKYIRYEHLYDDLKDLTTTLSIPYDIDNLPKMKTNKRVNKEPYQSYYDNETIDFVYNKLKWEIDYFNYTI